MGGRSSVTALSLLGAGVSASRCSVLFLIRPISDPLDLRYFVTGENSLVCGRYAAGIRPQDFADVVMASEAVRASARAASRSSGCGPLSSRDVRRPCDQPRLKGRGRSEILWSQIETVSVRTLIGGAWAADVFWVIRGKRQKLVLPFGAYGESDLVRAMQERLAGFDNMAVVEGLSSAGEGEIQVWPADPDFTGLV